MSTKTIIHIFKDFCKGCLLEFAQLSPNIFLSTYYGEHFQWPVYFEAFETGGRFTSILPIIVPQNKRAEVGTLIHVANNTLIASGGFQFDVDTGEIHFTTAIDVADGVLTVCQLFMLYDQHRIVDYWIERVFQTVFTSSQQTCGTGCCLFCNTASQGRRASLGELLNDVNVDLN